MSPANAPSAPYVLPGNDAGIGKLKPPQAGERCYWHADIKGLHLRMLPGGGSAWRYQYRDAAGVTRKVTLGKPPALTLSAAVLAAKALAGDIAKGDDPAAARRGAKQEAALQESLGTVIGDYLEWKRPRRRARTLEEIERYLTQHFAHLHAMPIGDVDQIVVDTAVKRVKDRNGPTAANRAASALSGLLMWAGAKGKVTATVALSARLLPREAEKSVDRVLLPAEVLAIWQEAAAADSGFGRIVQLLILTASRRSEMGDLTWDEVQSDAIVIGAERMKGKRQHAIPMMQAIHQCLPPRRNTLHVFGTSGTTGFSAWSQSQKRFQARLEKRLAKVMPSDWKMAPWTLHNFRHTFSTSLHNAKRASHHGIEACLAHALPGVAGTYSYADQLDLKCATLDLWHEKLRAWGLELDGGAA